MKTQMLSSASADALEAELKSKLTTTIEVAGDALGLCRAAAYNAARRGDIPTLRIGKRWVVPTGPLLAMLGRNPAVATNAA